MVSKGSAFGGIQGQSPWPWLVFDCLPSTNDFCRTRTDDPEFAVLARRQSRGRGSNGRSWMSPEGNMYLSVLLRPAGPARDVGQWSLRAGVALAEAVAPLLPDAAALRLKWPNDLLLGGRKLAGILVDSAADSNGRVAWVVIGFGLNLVAAPDLADRATASISELAVAPPPQDMAERVLLSLDHWRQQDFATVRAAWLRRSQDLGATMVLRQGERRIDGRFAGLAEDGRLLLHTGGEARAYAAGEISLQTGG